MKKLDAKAMDRIIAAAAKPLSLLMRTMFDAAGGVGVTGFNAWSFLVAIIGSIIVLVVYHAFTGRRAL